MKTEIKEFKRMELFKCFQEKTNPFSFVTTEIDITNLYQFCKKNKNFYATIGYYVALAMNSIDEFKYRYEENKIYKYDKINPVFTQMFEDETIGFFRCELTEDYNIFIEEFLNTQKKFKKNHQSYANQDQAEVWLSCEPWFHATSLIPPFDKKAIIPQVIWDQFNIKDDRCYINLMVMIHHGFADGYHIGKFFNKFSELVENINPNK